MTTFLFLLVVALLMISLGILLLVWKELRQTKDVLVATLEQHKKAAVINLLRSGEGRQLLQHRITQRMESKHAQAQPSGSSGSSGPPATP